MKINLEVEGKESENFFKNLVDDKQLRFYLRKQNDWVCKLKPILIECDSDTGAVVIELQVDEL